MDVIDLPVTTRDVTPFSSVTLRHDQLNLDQCLRQGQVVIGQDEDGRHWHVSVLEVRFLGATTTYSLRVGSPLARGIVRHLGPERLSRGRFGSGDVAESMRDLVVSVREAAEVLLPAS